MSGDFLKDITEPREPEIKFEYNWPIDEVAQLVSDVRAEEDSHKYRRSILTPGQVKGKLEDYLQNPNATELVLVIDGELIGCAFSFEEFKEDLEKQAPGINFFSTGDERVFCIREVDVKLDHRGSNFGEMIMKRIMQDAQAKGATKLILSVFPYDDLPAFNLYKKLGFKEAAPEDEQVSKNFYYMSYDCPKK